RRWPAKGGRRERAHDADQDLSDRGPRVLQPDLALPDLGVRGPRAAPPRAEVDLDLHGHGRAAVPQWHLARLLRDAEGPERPLRLHPRTRPSPEPDQDRKS